MQRDVSTHEELDSKDPDHDLNSAKHRKRVSRACNRCRAKKDRCDGQRPSCTPCATAHLACSYEQSTKKRGLPEGYVRGLEKLWALSIGKISGLEDAVSQITEQHHQELLELWNHDVTGEDLHTIWKESKVLSELEYLLSGLERDTPTGSKRKRDKDSEEDTPNSEPSSLHRKVQYRVSRDTTGSETSHAEILTTMTSPDFLSKATLPEGASKLLEHYFAYTHCWFPILARPQVLRTFYEQSRNASTDQRSDPQLAVLWAIFAYTTAQNRDPNTTDAVLEKSRRIARAKQFRQYARSLIPSETDTFAVGHVQALLLLALLDVGLGEWHSGWILVGVAIRSALDLRIGSKVNDKREVGVLQGCFILDTLIANHLEHPVHLRRSDMVNLGYLEEDGHEEWEPWKSSKAVASQQEPGFIISCFNRLYDAFLILNDAISFTSSNQQGRQAYFEKCANDMTTLQARFPKPVSSQPQLVPHQVYLRLFSCSISISVLQKSVESGAPAASLAKLACEIMAIITQYAQTPALGLLEVPSVLEHPIRAACYAAIAAKPVFEATSSLSSYTSFARSMTDYVSVASGTWPVFSHLTGLWQSALHSEDQSRSESVPMQTLGRNHRAGRDKFPFLQPGTFERSFPHTEWASDIKIQGSNASFIDFESPLLTHQQDEVSGWSSPAANNLRFSSVELDRNLNGGSLLEHNIATGKHNANHTGPDGLDRPDMTMSGVDQFSPAGFAMPAVEASPSSFHGDEVDAIFHNLVHLDTTEWTSSRSQGLKDFGFADDTTFQAFCNDPERLVAPGAPFGQDQSNEAEFWASGSFQPFQAGEKYRDQEERVGWWG